jgi:hypothetical protein
LLAAFSPLVTSALVVVAFGGGVALVRGFSLLRGSARVAKDPESRLSVEVLAARGREHAKAFARLAQHVPDPALRTRVEHLAERLQVVFTEMVRRPEALDGLDAVQSFVMDILPDAVRILEAYLEAASRLGVGAAEYDGLADTVNMIADTVKAMHERLVQHRIGEFRTMNRTLQDRMEFHDPTIRLRRKEHEHG